MIIPKTVTPIPMESITRTVRSLSKARSRIALRQRKKRAEPDGFRPLWGLTLEEAMKIYFQKIIKLPLIVFRA